MPLPATRVMIQALFPYKHLSCFLLRSQPGNAFSGSNLACFTSHSKKPRIYISSNIAKPNCLKMTDYTIPFGTNRGNESEFLLSISKKNR